VKRTRPSAASDCLDVGLTDVPDWLAAFERGPGPSGDELVIVTAARGTEDPRLAQSRPDRRCELDLDVRHDRSSVISRMNRTRSKSSLAAASSFANS
jgi:hypothetical protein